MELIEKIEKNFPNALALLDFYIENNKEKLKTKSFEDVLINFCESENFLISAIPGYNPDEDLTIWKPMVVSSVKDGTNYISPELYNSRKKAILEAVIFSFESIEKKLSNKEGLDVN